jgi:hypothetical protein
MADNAYANDIATLNARLMQEQAAASQEATEGRHRRGQGPG